MNQDYVDRLTRQINQLNLMLAKAEQGYGGGGYDPSEGRRLAGKIEGLKMALQQYREMSRG